jgi:tRNA nucleotidyltransferase (CCA-adding enzyme)
MTKGDGARSPPASRPLRSALEEEVAVLLRPTPDDLARLAKTREALVAVAERVAKEKGMPLRRALVAGSAARETFLPSEKGGRLDLDLFLLFDPALPREELARKGLELAGALLDSPEKRYAEHPYLRGSFQGYAVDAVPGYAVERGDRPLTAVDRTPFHHAYLQPKLDDRLRDEVRLLRRFLRTLGVYGADARTEGFSGYLVELLVVRSGSFGALLQEARRWRVGERLAPPGPEPATAPDTALVLADPVDPHRNVASALSRANFALFLLAVGEYVHHPRREFFLPPPSPEPTWTDLVARSVARGSETLVLQFPAPDLVDDILYPQLRKTERALAGPLERWGFEVLGTASACDSRRAAVAVEIDRPRRGPVGPHGGPPAGSPEVAKFLGRWGGDAKDREMGPYVTPEGKLQVDVVRPRTAAIDLLRAELPQMGFGKSLQKVVSEEGVLSRLADVSESPEVRIALSGLFDRGLPWRNWPPLTS